MTSDEGPFRTVMRGYDPAQVDERLSELTQAAETAERQAREATTRADQLAASLAAALGNSAASDYAGLGARVGQILTLAQEEAEQLRATADAEIRRQVSDLEAASVRIRADAEIEAGRIVAEARARADQLTQESEQELATAIERRDSINAQLASVRQALADLTGNAELNGSSGGRHS